MRAYIVLTHGNADSAQAMELILRTMFQNMSILATVAWYFDELVVDAAVCNSDGIEYGVRVDVTGLDPQTWAGFLLMAAEPWQFYGNVVVRSEQ